MTLNYCKKPCIRCRYLPLKGFFRIWGCRLCTTIGLILYAMVIRYMNSDHIGGIIVSVHPTCAVDRGFQLRLGQTENYKISTCIFCFSAKLTSLRRRTKTSWLRIMIMCLCRNNMSTCWLLFQWTSTIHIQLRVIEKQYKADIIIILSIHIMAWTLGASSSHTNSLF